VVPDEIYEKMLGMLAGRVRVKVAERDRVFNNARARIWRGKGAYSIEGGYYIFMGEKL
jgi:hypothetical protein